MFYDPFGRSLLGKILDELYRGSIKYLHWDLKGLRMICSVKEEALGQILTTLENTTNKNLREFASHEAVMFYSTVYVVTWAFYGLFLKFAHINMYVKKRNIQKTDLIPLSDGSLPKARR